MIFFLLAKLRIIILQICWFIIPQVNNKDNSNSETETETETEAIFYHPQIELGLQSIAKLPVCYTLHTSNLVIVVSHPNVYYRPQWSWGKVIFSQASVILLTGGGGLLPPGGGGSSQGEEVLPPRGASSWGVLPRGGGPGGDPAGTATAAGGTHPTGMHSCVYILKWDASNMLDIGDLAIDCIP